MDDLSTCLDMNKWQPLDNSKKSDFKEYQVMKPHKKLTDTSFKYLVVPDDGEDSRSVIVEFVLKGKDPLKDVRIVELRIGQEDKVTGIAVDEDCFELI